MKLPRATMSTFKTIEALCAALPEAFAHSPSQMPLSCPVEPPSQRELHKDRVAAVVAWRFGRAPPGPGSPSPAPRPVVRPPQRPTPRRSRARPSCVTQGQACSPFTCRPPLSLGRPRRHRGDDRGGELQGLVFSTLHAPARALFYDAAKLFLNSPSGASTVQRARDDEETVDRARVAAQHAFFGFRRSKMTRATMNTFALPSFAAPGFCRMKMTRATTSTMVVVAAAVVVTNLARG